MEISTQNGTVRLLFACTLLLAVPFAQFSSADGEWTSCIFNGKESYYRAEAEACCQGNIFRRAENLVENCCNGELYDSTTGRCCGDRTWYNDDTHFCCGDEVYSVEEYAECCDDQRIDTTSQTCCFGRVVEAVGECCGDSDVYDDATGHCCVPGPGYTGRVAHVGREAVVSGFLECCGAQTIDTRSMLCCRGSPTDRKSSFTACCGPESYDTRTQVCCEAGVEYSINQLVDGKVECCGLTPYNDDIDQCCASVITPNIGDGKCCYAEAYNPLQASCCNHVSSSIPEIPGVQACCRGESYLKTQHVCCANFLHALEAGKECCGSDLYDANNQLCCGDNVVDKAAPTSRCCGRSDTFDPERETCCHGQVSDFPNGLCCRIQGNVYQAYQPQVNQCCTTKMWWLPHGSVQSNETKCCGIHALASDQLCNQRKEQPVTKQSTTDNAICCKAGPIGCQTYNKETHKCHRGFVVKKKIFPKGISQCGDRTFNVDTDMCCRGVIQSRTHLAGKPYPQECCGNKAYVPEWHTCINKHYSRIDETVPSRYAKYCRNNIYNNQTDICDDSNGHIRPIEEMELALKACDSFDAERGYYPYDPAEQECCGDVLIGPGETCCRSQRFRTPGTGVGEGRCCDYEGFNPHNHVCCDEVLHPITVQGQRCCGRHFFDPANTTAMCCNSTLRSIGNGKTACTDGVAHRPADTVCLGRVYPVENGQCCGPQLMDSLTDICCQDKFLYSRATHGNTCCGRVAYDASDVTKKCCSNSLYQDVGNAVCCQSRLTDPKTETCWAVGDVQYGFNQTVTFLSEGSVVAAGHTACNGLVYPIPGECCGDEIVRRSEANAICCGGRKQSHRFGPRAVCCGGEVLDAELYMCCGEKPLRKHYHWMTCCNGVAVGKRQCQAPQPRLPPSDLTLTCGGLAYNASTTGCCNSQIYNLREYGCLNDTLQPLCGVAAYDSGSLVCCAGATYDASTTGCCSGEPYELGRRTCCADRLYRVKNGSCCGPRGEKAFNRNRYACCDDQLRRKKKGRSQCCGGSVYNPRADTCCNQSLTRGVSRGRCCGNRAFDPARRMCCPRTETLSRRRRNSEDISERCCAPGFEYNKDTGICQPQDCRLCENLKSTLGWQSHLSKRTLIRGTASNLTATPSHHVLRLTSVSHLDHDKRQSRLDSRELAVIVPSRCRCHLSLGKAYVAMSDAQVVPPGGPGTPSLALLATDFLARARNKLGTKIKHRLCKLG